MSDRIKGFWVALEKDTHELDFEEIKNAVLMIKGIIDVKESVANGNDYLNRAQIAHEFRTKLLKFLNEEK